MASQNPYFFLDETGTDKDSKILAVACILTDHPQYLRKKVEELKQRMFKEKRFKDIPSVQDLRERGFHYCEDHQDVKNEFIELISEMPFESYICYEHKKSDHCHNDSFEWYDKLFCKLMHDRLRKHRESIINICFEQHHNSVENRRQELGNLINQLIKEIKCKDNREFLSLPMVKSAGKGELCLSVVDYVAAIFKDYEYSLCQDRKVDRLDNLASWQSRNFAMIRPKLRVIHDYGTGEFFTRWNPFP